MIRYQIRLPENMTLENLVADMTVKAWMMIERNLDFSHHFKLSYSVLQNRIVSIFLEHVTTYDLCGAVEVCTQGIETMPLSEDSEIQTQSGDSILHLILETGLEAFLDELALKSIDSIKEVLKPQREAEVFHILRMVFRSALAEYIYYNPQCGSAKICESSEEINAWGEVSRKLLN
jgi:hypothetical protein